MVEPELEEEQNSTVSLENLANQDGSARLFLLFKTPVWGSMASYRGLMTASVNIYGEDEKRREFRGFILDIEAGSCDGKVLVIQRIDRFCRTVSQGSKFLEALEAHDIDIFEFAEAVNTYGSAGFSPEEKVRCACAKGPRLGT